MQQQRTRLRFVVLSIRRFGGLTSAERSLCEGKTGAPEDDGVGGVVGRDCGGSISAAAPPVPVRWTNMKGTRFAGAGGEP